jgi:hypothetical protein
MIPRLIALGVLASFGIGSQASSISYWELSSPNGRATAVSFAPQIVGYKDGGGGEGVTPNGDSAMYARYQGSTFLLVQANRVIATHRTDLKTGGRASPKPSSPLTPVPIPGAVWLFASGLLGLGLLSRRSGKSGLGKPESADVDAP